ncbi:hypothetical protein UFOVP1307_216 [uncultured Caudovirales phage]|uniref:Concanavalin A-like lectin/glucanases superfamily n=1 Tax=uncultured Caudovirales phage TaxID=2100421 RepID=A0A6J5RRK5_9CAUD|nr:hypothetical protein UFOVP651_130 [uncultured Caudovirales phage]CAB4171148.1 hypothetical protein UFOVP902_209 [uncultured Caudovirales phage]CAB4198692.1 hypothetical protein UFOVP1307_216 [uncultured Caudovirales phage]
MSTASGGPNTVIDGLILYLDAANTKSYVSGSTTWTDLSRGGNNGTLTNGPTFSSANGGNIVFNGSNNSIIIPYSGSTANNYTFNIVMKSNTMDSDPANRQTLFGLSNNGTSTFRQFDLEIWQNLGRGFRGTGGPTQNIDFFVYTWTPTADANNISMYTVTLYSTGQQIYVNGVLRNTISQAYVANFNTIRLATRVADNWWNGNCYAFSMYDRILTSQEILQNYNATKTRFGL